MRSPVPVSVALLLALAFGVFGARQVTAQLAGAERIVAVVGNDVILLTELEEQTVVEAAQEGIDPNDSAALAALRRRILERMVDDMVVVAAAAADDSVDVPESTLSEAVEAEMSEIRGRFPSPADFEAEIARSQWRTLENYRKNLRRMKQRELLAQAYLARHANRFQVAPVTDEEVRAYFAQNAARFGAKPAMVRIGELDLLVQPTEEALARAQTLADSLLGEIRGGADFAALAREFSDDRATAERGGDLGYFRKGVMVPAFEEAAFAIDSVGALAAPVRSAFGIHIIRLDDRQGEEVKARHILITPETSDTDRAAARALGEALVDSIAAGVSFDSLRVRYSMSPRVDEASVEGPLNQLPREWQDALRDLPPGGTTGLLPTPAGFAILRLEGRSGGEPYTYEELEPRLRSQLAQTKAQRAFISQLREDVFVDVRAPAELVGGAAAAPPPSAVTPAPYAPPALEPAPEAGQPPAGDAYVPPEPDRQPAAPVRPLEEPAPLADTPPPHEPPPALENPILGEDVPPPGRVDPAGGVDSTSTTPSPSPQR